MQGRNFRYRSLLPIDPNTREKEDQGILAETGAQRNLKNIESFSYRLISFPSGLIEESV